MIVLFFCSEFSNHVTKNHDTFSQLAKDVTLAEPPLFCCKVFRYRLLFDGALILNASDVSPQTPTQ